MPELLAKPGDYDGRFFLWRKLGIFKSRKWAGYKTREGFNFHGPGKFILRKLIDAGFKRYEPTIRRKRSQGWIKPHIAILDKAYLWVRSLDNAPTAGMGTNFKIHKDDVNDKMLNNINDMYLCMLDEDSFWDIRELLRLKYIHEHWSEIEPAVNQAYALTFGFDRLYKTMQAWTAPLPQDDGRDIKEINYVEMERKLSMKLKEKGDMDGMEHERERQDKDNS